MKPWRSVSWLAAIILQITSLFSGASSVQLVSLPHAQAVSGSTANGDSHLPAISADGRFVLFASMANNLAAGTNGAAIPGDPFRLNVFLRDRANATLSLISVDVNGTASGNGDSFPVMVSTNGRFALFESTASNLVSDDTNDAPDIFLRDLDGNTTTLVSINTNGSPGNGTSKDATMTPDGRFVAFVSAADNLVPDDTNGIPDVFVRDLQTGTTVVASLGAISTNVPGGLSNSESPEISDDGRYVAFFSTATNLVESVQTAGEIYVRDLVAGTTVLASGNALSILNSIQPTTNAISCNHALGSDGKFVAFTTSRSPRLNNSGIVLRYNLDSGATELVHTNAFIPWGNHKAIRTVDITPDGRFIVFVANTNEASGTATCVQVWDGQLGTTTLASGNLTNGVPDNSTCQWPAIDPTGRFVLFVGEGQVLTTNLSLNGTHLYVRDLQSNVTTLLDVTTEGEEASVTSFGIPRLSQEGRFVAFVSTHEKMVSEDRNRSADVFLRDTDNGTIELISARHPALSPVAQNGSTLSVSLNENGRFIAFSSDADNLVANDTNSNRDIFVRDLLLGTNILASIGVNGSSANGNSSEPVISASGRYVAFTSTANNLVPGDTNKALDVFVFDLQNTTLTLGSIATNGVFGNGSSHSPFISADGRYLVFWSAARNLAPGTFTQTSDNLYLRDLQTSTTRQLTTNSNYSFPPPSCVVTPNGRFIAFVGSLVGSVPYLYVWDNQLGKRVYTNSTASISAVAISPDGNRLAFSTSSQLRGVDRLTNATWVIANVISTRTQMQFSADGSFLTYATSIAQIETDTNGASDVYLHNFDNRTTTLVSRAFNHSQAANAASDAPAISADGRYVAYRSIASNIVPNFLSEWPNLYLYDHLSGQNTLLSLNVARDSGGNHWVLPPVFSGDGHSLMFPSTATDLVSGDFNSRGDLFAFTFLYASITRDNLGAVISWPATAWQTFRVQFKNNVDEVAWQDLNSEIVILNNLASTTDPSPNAARRFYRIVAF